MSRVLNQRQVTQYIHSSEAVVRTPHLRQYQLSAVNEGGGGAISVVSNLQWLHWIDSTRGVTRNPDKMKCLSKIEFFSYSLN